MPTEKFDAYGEVLADAVRGRCGASGAASAVLSRAGQYVFWLLVIIIVSARIMLYPAAPSFEVGSTGGLKHAVTR